MIEKTNTGPSPFALDPRDFNERIGRLHSAAVMHGADPDKAAAGAIRYYYKIDPVATAYETNPTTNATLHASLGRLVDLTGAVQEKRRPELYRGMVLKPKQLTPEVQLDRAELGLRVPTVSRQESVAGIQAVMDSTHESITKKKGQIDIPPIFSNLSSQALMLHLDAQALAEKRRKDGQPRPGSAAILKASLGNLIIETAESMDKLHDVYAAIRKKGGTGDAISGKLVEMMYFGYRLLTWYKSDYPLEENYIRFAFTREDSSFVDGGPRRSYDTVERTSEASAEPELVQVKSWLSGQVYNPSIKVWRPNYQGMVKETDEIITAFKTVIHNDASDSKTTAAWRELSLRFDKKQ
jgi:hypothetical protein